MPVAVFTGASRGIGAALTQRAGPLCKATLAIGRTAPATPVTRFLAADLARPAEVTTALTGLHRMIRGEDVWLFDAAGVLSLGRAGEARFATAASEVFAVNAVAPLLIGAALTAAEPERLTVVHLTSGAAHRPIPGWAAYGMAKVAAALGWRTFAAERPGVRLHLIDPGVVDTDMQQLLREAGDAAAAPADRLKTPSQAADEVLASSGFLS